MEAAIFDLIVIGAGPAGTSAAITAARSGVRVLLLEAGRFPRHKVCGEFVSPESLDLLSCLLPAQHRALLSDCPRIPAARLFLDDCILRTSIDPPAASIARFDLDAALLHSAESAGVEVRLQTSTQEVSGNAPFRVVTTAGDFAASAIVNASGRWSKLNLTGRTGHSKTREAAHAEPVRAHKWLGVKVHFSEPSPPNSVDLYFFDGGYCGVQPVRLADDPACPRINVCAMLQADRASSLAQVFALHPALRERSLGWEAVSQLVSTSPLLFREPKPERNGILFVGDAACFVDPFVGDGISLALRSGALAAECLAPFFQQSISLQTAIENYAAAYIRNFGGIFNTSSRIRHMLQLPRPIRRAALHILERTPAATRYLVRKTRAPI